MIYQVEIENFYSIRQRQTIDLAVDNRAPDAPGRLDSIHADSLDRAPRIVALFGANASGKTNVLRALAFLAWFARDSFNRMPGQSLPYMKFHTNEAVKKPTRLSVSFPGLSDLSDPESPLCPYVYTVEIGPRAEQGKWDRIQHESLQFRPSGERRMRRLIERRGDGEVKTAPEFRLGREIETLKRILKAESSVLCTLAQLNHPFAVRFQKALETVVSNIAFVGSGDTVEAATHLYTVWPAYLEALNRDISRIDLGIEAIATTQLQGGVGLRFKHTGLDDWLEFQNESVGTQRFVLAFPRLHAALQTGGIAIIDELDVAIHPLVLPEILRCFGDPDRNPHGAQLWMSCHTPSIMDELMKEEVVLCEKGVDGATEVFALTDVRGLRRDLSLQSVYLGGSLGGVPKLG